MTRVWRTHANYLQTYAIDWRHLGNMSPSAIVSLCVFKTNQTRICPSYCELRTVVSFLDTNNEKVRTEISKYVVKSMEKNTKSNILVNCKDLITFHHCATQKKIRKSYNDRFYTTQPAVSGSSVSTNFNHSNVSSLGHLNKLVTLWWQNQKALVCLNFCLIFLHQVIFNNRPTHSSSQT